MNNDDVDAAVATAAAAANAASTIERTSTKEKATIKSNDVRFSDKMCLKWSISMQPLNKKKKHTHTHSQSGCTRYDDDVDADADDYVEFVRICDACTHALHVCIHS